MIELLNVQKEFGSFTAVKNLDLNIKQGEFLTLLGPSGCGKTTTLRMIAGFETPTSGEILMDGVSLLAKQPYERNLNTVFQSYALFPHMTVWDNVAFGLRMHRVPRNEIAQRVKAALEMVQLPEFGDRLPRQLSGGQQQRVAIARAVVNRPRVLLLDEPLGALDLKMRKQMQLELKHLQRHLGITFVYVTHDQEEALIMSDRIGVMHAGVLEQIGTPDEIYERPATAFVADFIGETNLLPATVGQANGSSVLLEMGDLRLRVPTAGNLASGQHVTVAIRPEHLTLGPANGLTRSSPNGEDDQLEVTLIERIYAGPVVKTVVRLQTGKDVLITDSTGRDIPFKEGDRAMLKFAVGKVVILRER
ncbi:MAG: ABC transporter ATP-binding protein [Desulforudis sp.]|nr:ABC transporter ATP-binding protein [Clostridia bacterium]RJX17875.1 MAG: ABC transporter ATP-binding protein [Desulforudis sp.]